ncbi:P-loop guanosine triphosphatase YjiA, partial [Bienertia sinuspersici]
LANPSSITQTFYAKDAIFNDVKLDGFVTLVDAEHAEGIVNEVVEQIAYAERLVVNKKINRMAHLKQTQFGNVDLDYALGIRVFDFERIESVITEESSKEYHDHHKIMIITLSTNTNMNLSMSMTCHDHTHDPGGSAINIICEGSLDLDKDKGLLSVQGMDERFVFQGVHDIFKGSSDRPGGPNEPRTNKL